MQASFKDCKENNLAPALSALLVLLALEIICFGPGWRQIGFYLDDWFTVCMFHWAPKDALHCFQFYWSHDPRVTPRPVEAAFFALNYLLFGAKPLGWHLLNAALEVLGAWFFFLSLCQLQGRGRNLLPLAAAMIFLVYPNHDASHYWATCDSETLSAALCLASMWLAFRAAARARLWQSLADSALSAFCFILSAFCYETFLPLAAANLIGALVIARKTKSSKEALRLIATLALAYALSIAALLFYTRVLLPPGTVQVHAATLNAAVMLKAVGTGVFLNTPEGCLPFFLQQVRQAFNLNPTLAILSALSITVLGSLSLMGYAALKSIHKQAESEQSKPSAYPHLLLWLVTGLSTVVCSYLIFGLNKEYVPALQGLLSRINYGASMGVAMVLSALLCWLGHISKKSWPVAVSTALTVAFLSLVDQGMAQPWELSWQTQKTIFQALQDQSGKISPGATLLLAHCPRYVMWSPLFDGVWDFGSMVKLATHNDTISGGVISDRMQVGTHSIKDISCGYVCAEYSFKDSYLVMPPSFQPVSVQNGPHFVDLVDAPGNPFSLSPETIRRWRQQLASNGKGNLQ